MVQTWKKLLTSSDAGRAAVDEEDLAVRCLGACESLSSLSKRAGRTHAV